MYLFLDPVNVPVSHDGWSLVKVAELLVCLLMYETFHLMS